MGSLTAYRRQVDAGVASHQAAKAAYQRARDKVDEHTTRLDAAREAQQALQDTAAAVQQAAHRRIAAVVARCLTAVFDEPYDFRVNFERRRGRTEASLDFVRGGHAVDPMTASGGGVVDVAAFALRLACLMLTRPAVRRLLVLDEPFKFVSAEYRGRVRQLLDELAAEMGVQVVMVTHIEELETGKVVRL